MASYYSSSIDSLDRLQVGCLIAHVVNIVSTLVPDLYDRRTRRTTLAPLAFHPSHSVNRYDDSGGYIGAGSLRGKLTDHARTIKRIIEKAAEV
jgi:hypothetical protein